MTTITLNSATEDPRLIEAINAPMFYVVSKRKLAILYIATLGLYFVYWFYKNWTLYKGKWPDASKFGTTISPVARACLPIFFVHSLFAKVKKNGMNHLFILNWRSRLHATLLVVILIGFEAIDAGLESSSSSLVRLLSIATILPALVPLLRAQDMINLSCNDPEGLANSRFSGANIVWIVIGVLMWLFTISEMLVQQH